MFVQIDYYFLACPRSDCSFFARPKNEPRKGAQRTVSTHLFRSCHTIELLRDKPLSNNNRFLNELAQQFVVAAFEWGYFNSFTFQNLVDYKVKQVEK